MAFTYSPKIVTDGLVFAVDAGNTKSYPGSGTTWKDLSGNGNDGTLTNGPTFDSGNGGSIVFDGSNDYVNLPSNVIGGFNQLTYGVWVYVENLNNTSGWPAYIGSTVGNNSSINNNLGIFRNSIYQHFEITTVAQNYSVEGNIEVPVQEWYYAAMTWDGNNLTEFVNGQQGKTISTVGETLSNTTNFVLGNHTTNVHFFNGSISSVQVYNKSLSTTEVLQNYNALKSRFGL